MTQRQGNCAVCGAPIMLGEATEWTELGLAHERCVPEGEPEAA